MRSAVQVLFLGVALSCGSDSGPTGSQATIASYLTGVATLDGLVVGTLHTGSPPPSAGGPGITTHTSGTPIAGGSSLLTVGSDADFSTVIVAIEGVSGYYELTGLSGTTSTLVLTVSQTPPSTSFALQLALGASDAALSPYTDVPIGLTTIVTGDVQVSVSWDSLSDVDLHVVEPGGEEIYFGHRTSTTGGQLDLVSNTACAIDSKNTENVSWPTGSAPHGEYIVRLDYFSSCGVQLTNYVVTVQVSGQSPQTFTGIFNGEGDGGGQGSGTVITQFTY